VSIEQFAKASAVTKHLVVGYTEPVLLRVIKQCELQQSISGIRATPQFALVAEEP
jgi:hypothetical protein